MTERARIIDWRSKIDAIDTALLHLLNLRTELALEVGRLKADEGVALRVPAREQEILSRMKSLNPGPLANDSVAKIYEVILRESIQTQQRHGYGGTSDAKENRRPPANHRNTSRR